MNAPENADPGGVYKAIDALRQHLTDNTITERVPKPGERWKHWKNGDLVTVMRVVLHCDTKLPHVVYRHKTDAGNEWIRPLAEWHDRDDPRFAGKARFEFEADDEADIERKVLYYLRHLTRDGENITDAVKRCLERPDEPPF